MAGNTTTSSIDTASIAHQLQTQFLPDFKISVSQYQKAIMDLQLIEDVDQVESQLEEMLHGAIPFISNQFRCVQKTISQTLQNEEEFSSEFHTSLLKGIKQMQTTTIDTITAAAKNVDDKAQKDLFQHLHGVITACCVIINKHHDLCGLMQRYNDSLASKGLCQNMLDAFQKVEMLCSTVVGDSYPLSVSSEHASRSEESAAAVSASAEERAAHNVDHVNTLDTPLQTYFAHLLLAKRKRQENMKAKAMSLEKCLHNMTGWADIQIRDMRRTQSLCIESLAGSFATLVGEINGHGSEEVRVVGRTIGFDAAFALGVFAMSSLIFQELSHDESDA